MRHPDNWFTHKVYIAGMNFQKHHLFQLPDIELLNLEPFNLDFAKATPGAIS